MGASFWVGVAGAWGASFSSASALGEKDVASRPAADAAAAAAAASVRRVSSKASMRVRSWPALWRVPSVSSLRMGVAVVPARSAYSKP